MEGYRAGALEHGICQNPADAHSTAPLLLRHETGGYNCLHQDLYGEIAFPLQLTRFLSLRDIDYTGGEFLLVEQRPRAQSRGEAITTEQGEIIIFATRDGPRRGRGVIIACRCATA
jgi:uncharacterized protein